MTYYFERFCPSAAGLLAFILFLKFSLRVSDLFKDSGIDWATTYTPMAGIFAVIAGFLAAFYGSVQAIADTRLQRVARSQIFITFIHDLKEATIAGFVLCIISLPYMVVSPSNVTYFKTRLAIAFWFGASIYALTAFLRVGRLLFFVFEHQPPEDQGAG